MRLVRVDVTEMKKWVEKGVIRREMTRYKYMGLMGRYVTGVMWWAMTEMIMKGVRKMKERTVVLQMMEQEVREIKRSLMRGVGSEMK